MYQPISLYNTASRRLELFESEKPPYVGLYLCGPTVYGPAHLGHARSAITIDVVVRTLRHWGYQVTYVRNITDVGHLVAETEEGEDKIVQQAKIEGKPPAVVAQQYVDSYLRMLDLLNVLRPDIAPHASGHIPEQIALVQILLERGYAYVVNGSVYFDLGQYTKHNVYGTLSKRKIEELREGTRPLEKGEEKKNPLDFAIWKKAAPNHLMQWASPWGSGFPGWHLECSAMSKKYLGLPFDIHAGGLDLLFPHHECEIAQNKAAYNSTTARYWLHNNMVTLEGQKMSKSIGNVITLAQCFSGGHPLLKQAYSPMSLRFFMLAASYRSVLNFSNEALLAAHKGYYRLLNGYNTLRKLKSQGQHVDTPADPLLANQIEEHCQGCYKSIASDFHTPKVLAHLFELARYIQAVYEKKINLSLPLFEKLASVYITFFTEILGFTSSLPRPNDTWLNLLLEIYETAKHKRDYKLVERIREALQTEDIVVQDRKEHVDWSFQ